MPGQLSRFRIEALHNTRTIDLPIKDNKIVLVGENGTGKSTVANFIYFFLTRQWTRMLEYDFKTVLANLDGTEIELSRSDLDKAVHPVLNRWTRIISRSLPQIIIRDLERTIQQRGRLSPSQIARYADMARVPPAVFEEWLALRNRLYHEPSLFEEGSKGKLSEKLKTIDQALGNITDQVLYLPTYRRIEQDLRSIFPELESEVRHARQNLAEKERSSNYIEIVEFGMEDVERTIQHKMNGIKDSVRNDLNNLTGIYLRDVIQGKYRRSENLIPMLAELDETTINAIFSRIPPAILSEHEQKRLKDIITQTQSTGHIDEEDKVVAHFLTQLIDLHRQQEVNETDVREFVRVCNDYLSGKKFVYNNSNFEISIVQDASNANPLKLSMLSSGEKQIVSLFSHIYLSGNSGYFVIIDEPELSLSVIWQRRFLPDILATKYCHGLIAVTHSPFIFENELDAYVRSLEEFVEPVDVTS